jgi:ABC-2 type transport system ATP-binding protein
VTEPVVQTRGVCKDFLLPHLRSTTLKSRFVHMLQRQRVMEVQHALSDIDLEIEAGEFLGLVGRNGSGKSTLLKILAGIYTPTAGTVQIIGRLVPFIELGVGFNPELTGRENVYLNGALLGFSRREVDAMYDDIVAFAELEGSMDQKLKNYSSGMQVRIAFSVATRARADILLVDEVLAVGDVAFQRKCFDHFRALKKAGTTIVLVTHDMRLVREFCDRVILIEDSRIIAEGSAEHVAYEYARLFAPQVLAAQGDADPGLGHRSGAGDVRFTEVLAPDLVGPDDALVLELEATAERAVADVSFDMMLTDKEGTPLLGASHNQKHQLDGGLAAGERVRLRWTVPAILSGGRHHVDLTITDRHELVVYDSWKEAASFIVERADSTTFPVSPQTTLEIARVSGAAETAGQSPRS